MPSLSLHTHGCLPCSAHNAPCTNRVRLNPYRTRIAPPPSDRHRCGIAGIINPNCFTAPVIMASVALGAFTHFTKCATNASRAGNAFYMVSHAKRRWRNSSALPPSAWHDTHADWNTFAPGCCIVAKSSVAFDLVRHVACVPARNTCREELMVGRFFHRSYFSMLNCFLNTLGNGFQPCRNVRLDSTTVSRTRFTGNDSFGEWAEIHFDIAFKKLTTDTRRMSF